MGAAENKELVRNMFAELSKGNSGAFLDAMADDVRYTIIGKTKYSGTFNGKQELAGRLLEPLMAQLESGIALTPEAIIGDGDFVVMQGQGKARTKTGKDYNNTYCLVYRLANGKIRQVTEYLDTELVNTVLGR